MRIRRITISAAVAAGLAALPLSPAGSQVRTWTFWSESNSITPWASSWLPAWMSPLPRRPFSDRTQWMRADDAPRLRLSVIRCDRRRARAERFNSRCLARDEADLRDARLGRAFLVGTSLRGADLRGAYLRLAKLDGADLSDANLDHAEGLTQAQLERAHCNSGTKLPAGLIGVEDAKR